LGTAASHRLRPTRTSVRTGRNRLVANVTKSMHVSRAQPGHGPRAIFIIIKKTEFGIAIMGKRTFMLTNWHALKFK
jgi:hypothetical protein